MSVSDRPHVVCDGGANNEPCTAKEEMRQLIGQWEAPDTWLTVKFNGPGRPAADNVRHYCPNCAPRIWHAHVSLWMGEVPS